MYPLGRARVRSFVVLFQKGNLIGAKSSSRLGTVRIDPDKTIESGAVVLQLGLLVVTEFRDVTWLDRLAHRKAFRGLVRVDSSLVVQVILPYEETPLFLFCPLRTSVEGILQCGSNVLDLLSHRQGNDHQE
jgi:hypothetical protein